MVYQNKNNRKSQIVIRIDDVLARVSTKDGLEYYGVHFNSRGFAPCPFHNERTPSFHYNSKTDRYYCFSCGKSGNIINFVADYFNYSLPNELRQVLERINDDFNLGLAKVLSAEEKKAYQEDKRLNKFVLEAEKHISADASKNYDKWSRIHGYLYRAYLEIDKSDIELGDLIEQLDEALNDFSGTTLRAWPLEFLTENQAAYVAKAEEYIEAEELSFDKFQKECVDHTKDIAESRDNICKENLLRK